MPNYMHHGHGIIGLSAVWQRQRGNRHCHVVGIFSFKNMNSAHGGGRTDSLERQGSETRLKIQNGEKDGS